MNAIISIFAIAIIVGSAFTIIIASQMSPNPTTPISSPFTSRAFLPKTTAWYWDVDTISNDTALRIDIQNMKSLGFDSIAVYDEPFADGWSDNNFNAYRLTTVLQIAGENQMLVLPLLGAFPDDNGFFPQEWRLNNSVFHNWMTAHLKAIGKAYTPYRSTIAGFVWDDVQENNVSNYTEFVTFVFKNLNLSKSYVQIFDTDYTQFDKIQLKGNSMVVQNTMSFVYFFASQTGKEPDWRNTQWIKDANLTERVNGGIILNCYDNGWSPTILSKQAAYARQLGLHIQYYAYRRGYPETMRTIYWHPEMWAGIRAINQASR